MAEKRIVLGQNGDRAETPQTPNKENEAPKTENVTPKRETGLLDPRKKSAPSSNGVGSHADNADNASGEGDAPGKKYPVFKERKLPVFSDEVKRHEDFEDEDEDDFTSDSVAMPVTHVDGSDVLNKPKVDDKNPKEFFAEDPNGELTNSMSELDELAYYGGTMPSVVPHSNAYPDYNSMTTSPYSAYDAENRLMQDYSDALSKSGMEEQPGYDPFVQAKKQKTKGTAKDAIEFMNSYPDPEKESNSRNERTARALNERAAKRERNAETVRTTKSNERSKPVAENVDKKRKTVTYVEVDNKAQNETKKQRAKAEREELIALSKSGAIYGEYSDPTGYSYEEEKILNKGPVSVGTVYDLDDEGVYGSEYLTKKQKAKAEKAELQALYENEIKALAASKKAKKAETEQLKTESAVVEEQSAAAVSEAPVHEEERVVAEQATPVSSEQITSEGKPADEVVEEKSAETVDEVAEEKSAETVDEVVEEQSAYTEEKTADEQYETAVESAESTFENEEYEMDEAVDEPVAVAQESDEAQSEQDEEEEHTPILLAGYRSGDKHHTTDADSNKTAEEKPVEEEKHEEYAEAPIEEKYEEHAEAPVEEKYEEYAEAPIEEKYEEYAEAPVEEKYEE